jgi:hypothetical protein
VCGRLWALWGFVGLVVGFAREGVVHEEGKGRQGVALGISGRRSVLSAEACARCAEAAHGDIY